MLLIGVQKIKYSARTSFSHSISGTDLIIGARSVIFNYYYTQYFDKAYPFNMSWKNINDIRAFKEVAWLIPISLGDSHRGYPVLGTTTDYFDHYKYGKKQALKLRTGQVFKAPFDVVLGSTVAKN